MAIKTQPGEQKLGPLHAILFSSNRCIGGFIHNCDASPSLLSVSSPKVQMAPKGTFPGQVHPRHPGSSHPMARTAETEGSPLPKRVHSVHCRQRKIHVSFNDRTIPASHNGPGNLEVDHFMQVGSF